MIRCQSRSQSFFFLLVMAVALIAIGASIDPPTTQEKYDVLVEKDGFVTFTAVWCGPCKTQHRENDVLRKRGYRVTYIDIDKDHDLFDYVASRPTVPYTVVVRKKEITHHYVGVTSWQTLEAAFKAKGK